MTTYLAAENFVTLQNLSEETGVAMGRIVDQALDTFFKEIKWRKEGERSVPPVDLEHYRGLAPKPAEAEAE